MKNLLLCFLVVMLSACTATTSGVTIVEKEVVRVVDVPAAWTAPVVPETPMPADQYSELSFDEKETTLVEYISVMQQALARANAQLFTIAEHVRQAKQKLLADQSKE